MASLVCVRFIPVSFSCPGATAATAYCLPQVPSAGSSFCSQDFFPRGGALHGCQRGRVPTGAMTTGWRWRGGGIFFPLLHIPTGTSGGVCANGASAQFSRDINLSRMCNTNVVQTRDAKTGTQIVYAPNASLGNVHLKKQLGSSRLSSNASILGFNKK